MTLATNSTSSFSALFASLKFGIKRSSKIELSSDSITNMAVDSPSTKLRRQALSLDFSTAEHSTILDELLKIQQNEANTDVKKRHAFSKRKSFSKKQSSIYNGTESLHNAILNGNVELTRQILLLENVDVNALLPPGWNALHHACRLGNLNIIKLLLEFGADTSIQNEDSLTPLLLAVTNGYFDVAAYLINDGGVSCKEVRNGFQAAIPYNRKPTELTVFNSRFRKAKSFDFDCER